MRMIRSGNRGRARTCRVTGVFLCALLGSGVIGSTPAAGDDPPAVGSAADGASGQTLQMTRVFAGECIGEPYPVAGRFAPIVAAIAPALIKESLARLGLALRKAGEAHTETRSATANVEISLNRVPQCVQITVGSFYLTCTRSDPDEECTELSGTDWLGFRNTGRAASAVKSMSHLEMVLADRPDVFFEGRLRWSRNGTGVEMEPSLLLYRKTVRSAFLRGNKRDIVMTLGIAEPGSAGDDKGAFGNLTLEGLTPSERLYNFAPGAGQSTIWIGASVAGVSEPAPRTLLLSFAETRKASEFLIFLADVLEGSKEPLQTALEDAIVPAKRAAAEIAAATAAVEAGNAAVTAEAGARDAVAAFTTARDSGAAGVRTKAAAAFTAMTNANLAAAKAGLAAPFSETELAEARAGVGS